MAALFKTYQLFKVLIRIQSKVSCLSYPYLKILKFTFRRYCDNLNVVSDVIAQKQRIANYFREKWRNRKIGMKMKYPKMKRFPKPKLKNQEKSENYELEALLQQNAFSEGSTSGEEFL